jgi:hypothetical protein
MNVIAILLLALACPQEGEDETHPRPNDGTSRTRIA